MRFWASLASFVTILFLQSLPLVAQDASWLQVEAQPDLATAEERARAYSALFPNVEGYQTGQWYAIVLGPMSREDAGQQLLTLRRENMIPRDSFIADGSAFGQQIWPLISGEDSGTATPETVTELTQSVETEVEAIPLETLGQAREAEDSLTKEEKKALQEALAWFGFYDGAIDGAYGKGTRGSFASWQEANGFEPTGVLRTTERQQLLAAEADEKALYGFALVNEAESGIEATLPLALVEFEGYEPPFVQFAPRQAGGPRLMLISEPGNRASLAGLYDHLQSMETVPAASPEAEPDRSLGEDSFTINAASSTLATYAWARAKDGQVKGFILTWTPENSDQMARIVSVMQSSFRSVGDKSLDPGLVPLDDAARQGLLTGLIPRKPAFTRSGFYVSSDGAILSLGRDLDSCSEITIDGDLTVVVAASDPSSGVALLKTSQPLAPAEIANFATTDPSRGTDIIVAGYSYGDKLPAPVLTYGRLDEAIGLSGETGVLRLSAKVLEGDEGGPVLSSTGAVIGLMTGPSRDASKTLPAGVVFSADAAALTKLLESNGVSAAAFDGNAKSPDDLAKSALGMTIRLDCWK